MKNNYKKMTFLLAMMMALVACGNQQPSSKQASSKAAISSNEATSLVTSDSKSQEQKTSEQQDQTSEKQQESSQEQKTSEKEQESSKQQESSTPAPSSSKQQQSSAEQGGAPKAEDYIISHEDGKKVEYIYEAECTDMRGKRGLGYSGGTTTYRDFAGQTEDGIGYISYLYVPGISVNFFVVSDRDVNDAKLSVRLGAEFIHVLLNPENYAFRVDTDLASIDDDVLVDVEQEGCLGNWDEFFLNFYELSETGGYIIAPWTCGSIDLDADGESNIGLWTTFEITASLSLKKGFNCISMITTNNSIAGGSNHGTMVSTAPVIDYLSIETTAQLGVFDVQDLGYGENACYIKK